MGEHMTAPTPVDTTALTDRLAGGTAPAAAPAVPAAQTVVPPAQPATQTPAPVATPGADDGEKDAAYWKAMSRKNEAAAKRLAAIEESQKTELQKASERAELAEKNAADNATLLLKFQVSQASGVPVALLNGTTKDELEKSALAALEFAGKPAPGQPAPPPNFGAGALGTPGAPDPSDPNALIRRMAGR